MNEVNGNYGIANSQDLHYISDVVNQVLDRKHEFGSISNFQTALKEVSLMRGREVQMNLVIDQNQLVGFNFSFKADPRKTTSTIAFKQSLELEQSGGSLTRHEHSPTTIDITATAEGNLATQTPQGKLVTAPPLKAKNLRVLSEASEELIESPSPGLKVNSSLARIAAHLASRNEIDGLWLAGMALKTGTTLAQSLEAENSPDMQGVKNAVIKRFEQVLPEQFAQLKNGDTPQPFHWKDPHSHKQYRFEFEAATFSETGKILTPIALKGFEQCGNSRKPVFWGQLIDEKPARWLVEQCDFSKAQLGSLAACQRYINPQKSVSRFEHEL